MINFPIYKTKCSGVTQKFNLNDPTERRAYFQAKAGQQIEELKGYLEKNTFVGFLLAKKAAGKGTRAKMFIEIFGSERVEHIAVGDIVREIHESLKTESGKRELTEAIQETYRSPVSIDEAIDALLSRSTQKLSVPTEFLLSLLKLQIEKIGPKALFIDGFPRSLDQVSYSLFFRQIMNLRPDPDFFVLIQTPENVINARLKSRVVCPLCQTSRNLKLLPTKFVDYVEKAGEGKSQSLDAVESLALVSSKRIGRFVLKCDNSKCGGFGKEIMTPKEGDILGIEAIRSRLETDGALVEHASNLQGIPKICLRSNVPVDQADELIDKYEITPEYSYKKDSKTGEIQVIEKPWVVEDDFGVESYSLLAPTDVLSLIHQLHELLLG